MNQFILKQIIKECYRELIEEAKAKQEGEEVKYSVALQGGSIGEKTIHTKSLLKGIPAKDIFPLYDNKADATEHVKTLNKQLSPGEKKYYRLKYIVVEVGADGKYTGK